MGSVNKVDTEILDKRITHLSITSSLFSFKCLRTPESQREPAIKVLEKKEGDIRSQLDAVKAKAMRSGIPQSAPRTNDMEEAMVGGDPLDLISGKLVTSKTTVSGYGSS